MKKSIIVYLIVFIAIPLVTLTGCIKNEVIVWGCTDPSSSNYNPNATDDNGTCEYTGKVVFWYNSIGSNATVQVGGQTGYITSYYPSYDPTCGSSGCATFTLPTGNYSFTASSTWSSWSGNVTVTKNGCLRWLLY